MTRDFKPLKNRSKKQTWSGTYDYENKNTICKKKATKFKI